MTNFRILWPTTDKSTVHLLLQHRFIAIHENEFAINSVLAGAGWVLFELLLNMKFRIVCRPKYLPRIPSFCAVIIYYLHIGEHTMVRHSLSVGFLQNWNVIDPVLSISPRVSATHHYRTTVIGFARYYYYLLKAHISVKWTFSINSMDGVHAYLFNLRRDDAEFLSIYREWRWQSAFLFDLQSIPAWLMDTHGIVMIYDFQFVNQSRIVFVDFIFVYNPVDWGKVGFFEKMKITFNSAACSANIWMQLTW